MKFAFLTLLALMALLFVPGQAEAACSNETVSQGGDWIIYTGDCEDDNEVLIQTGDMTRYDACFVLSTAGTVDIFVTIDNTNYSTAALSLTDYGATGTAPVLVTTAGRVYGFVSKFRAIRVIQNGATDAAASLICWDY